MPATVNPRKRPRQARSRATVEAILEAAARILEEGGAAACTTNAVAARAGVSIGSLYQYFPGRDALVAALVRSTSANLLAELEAAARCNDTEPDARLEAMVAAAVAHQLDRPRLARVLDLEEGRLPLDREAAAGTQAILDCVATGTNLPPDLARDCLGIARGMIDMAGASGETGHAALAARVGMAVRGYLRERGAWSGT
ncbi:MAG: TetR/AcrR family transcriptional regulator [Pseudomonadota bacterium]|nr:TetR/AcrR family transcriptional regulator [Pseudomonadota bacterium]